MILLHPIPRNLLVTSIADSQARVMPLAYDHTFSLCEGRKER